MTTVHTSSIQSLPLLARGKVRDNYAVGNDRILMVASDRLSAFDVIMGEPIPGKGVILTQMALWWFDRLGHLCPNHLTGDAPESVVKPEEVPQVKDRSMLVKRLKPAREAARLICKQRYLEFGCEGQAPKIKGDSLQVVAARYAKGELAQEVI